MYVKLYMSWMSSRQSHTSVDLLTYAHQKVCFCHKEHLHKKQQMGCHAWPQCSLSPIDSSILPDPCSVIACSFIIYLLLVPLLLVLMYTCNLPWPVWPSLPAQVVYLASCMMLWSGAYPNMSRCARLVSIVPLVYLACCMMVHSSSALHYVVPSVTHLQGAGLAVNQLTWLFANKILAIAPDIRSNMNCLVIINLLRGCRELVVL